MTVVRSPTVQFTNQVCPDFHIQSPCDAWLDSVGSLLCVRCFEDMLFLSPKVPIKQSSLCNKNCVMVNWRLYFLSVIPLSYLNHWFILDQKQSLSEERREERQKQPTVGNKNLYNVLLFKLHTCNWIPCCHVVLKFIGCPVLQEVSCGFDCLTLEWNIWLELVNSVPYWQSINFVLAWITETMSL